MSGPTSHTMSMHLYAMGLFVYSAIMLQRLMLLWLLALVPTLCHLLTNGHARPEDYVQFLADHSNKKTRKRLVAILNLGVSNGRLDLISAKLFGVFASLGFRRACACACAGHSHTLITLQSCGQKKFKRI